MSDSHKKARVLVVDDEPDIRTLVGLNIGLAGMEYGEASNGAEALEMLKSSDWDACVLDLMMPGTDGFTVLTGLAESGRLDDLTVVVLSARGTPSAAIKAMEMGAHTHLTKPFSPLAVTQILEELVAMTPKERDARRREGISRAGNLERLGVPTV